MKRLLILLLITSSLSCSKEKTKTCYQCEAISAGNTYNQNVCTSGDPYSKLPKSDAGGNLNWTCHQ